MESLPALVQDLGHPDRDRRAHCAEELTRRGEPVVLPLCELLRTGEPLQRCAAADVLASLADGRAISPLIGLLGYPDGPVRCHAAQALGTLDARAAVGPLAAAARAGPLEAGVQAVEALGKLGMRGAPGAVHALVETVDTAMPEVAAAALRALAEWARLAPSAPLREAIPVLWRKLGLFNRPSPDLQRACWSTLQAIDAATASLKDLPLPAGAPAAAENLPLPAGPAHPDAGQLPIVAEFEDEG